MIMPARGDYDHYDYWMAWADRIARADRKVPIYHRLCRIAWRVVIDHAARG